MSGSGNNAVSIRKVWIQCMPSYIAVAQPFILLSLWTFKPTLVCPLLSAHYTSMPAHVHVHPTSTFIHHPGGLYFTEIRQWLTSAGANLQSSPSSLATSSPGELGKSRTTTLAPFLTSLSAVALPRPDAPPVTKPTKPWIKQNKFWNIKGIV